uniref:Pectinesterase inhibitor domain-containing protein n=1 Tax=Lotus japonicus TaxID=34305 RepID=I3SWH8_LOTJA|nr:unknown [Lotus japonicus]
MENLKSLSLICNIFIVVATISMSIGHCRVLQPSDAQLVAKTCKNTPYPSACPQFLQADPRSSSADVTGLALIMVDVIQAKTNGVLNKISQLLKGGGDKPALNSCQGRYNAILKADIPQATQALKTGNPKFAEDGVADASVEANTCESGFSSGKSPLTSENNGMHIATEVARAIIRNLL